MSEFREAMEASAAAAADPAPAESGASTTETPQTGSQPAPAPSTQETPATPAQASASPAQAPGAVQEHTVPLSALREAREALKSYRWLPKEHVENWRDFYTRYHADPVETILGQVNDLLAHPVYGQTLRQRFGGGQAETDAEPQPDLRDPQTGETGWSAAGAKKWQQWYQRQLDAKVDAKLRPLQETFRQREQERAVIEAKAASNERASKLIARFESKPHFKEHKALITSKVEAYIAQGIRGDLALQQAYSDVLEETVIPNLSTAERRAMAASLQAKPGAASPNPARPGAQGTTKQPESFREILEAKYGVTS